MIEAAGRRVVRLMGTEVVMTKGKPLTSKERERVEIKSKVHASFN